MKENEHNWSVGDIVSLPLMTTRVGKSGLKSYEHLISSRYICISECDSSNRGILVKVLGKTTRDNITICGGEPFCKDEKVEMFMGDTYYSYRFPKLEELQTVLDIIRNHPALLDVFEKASMHLNIDSTFWVRDTASHLLLLKEPQFFDIQSSQLLTPGNNDSAHYRITVAYFYRSYIGW